MSAAGEKVIHLSKPEADPLQPGNVVVLGSGGQYSIAGGECGEAGGDAGAMSRRECCVLR